MSPNLPWGENHPWLRIIVLQAGCLGHIIPMILAPASHQTCSPSGFCSLGLWLRLCFMVRLTRLPPNTCWQEQQQQRPPSPHAPGPPGMSAGRTTCKECKAFVIRQHGEFCVAFKHWGLRSDQSHTSCVSFDKFLNIWNSFLIRENFLITYYLWWFWGFSDILCVMHSAWM